MNHRWGIFSFFLFAALLSNPMLPEKLGAEDTVHVVEKGETVYSISRSYRVSPEELMRYNDISDASKLQIGRQLKIPSSVSGSGAVSSSPVSVSSPAGTPSPAVTGQTEYRVVKDDTLYSIARRHGVGLQALLDLNGFSQSYVLKAGERIKIPAGGSFPVGTTGSGTASSAGAATGSTTGTTGTAKTSAGTGASGTAQSGGGVRQTASKTVDASLRWPVKPKEIAYMTGKLYGVVMTGERSESVKSLTQGTVISAGPYRGFGRVAIIQVTGGYLYVYGGCESLSVKEGDRIGPGTELGKLGIDAVSEKPQLFFMVYRSNAPIDPAKAPRA
jgi:LysM repeat protein